MKCTYKEHLFVMNTRNKNDNPLKPIFLVSPFVMFVYLPVCMHVCLLSVSLSDSPSS